MGLEGKMAKPLVGIFYCRSQLWMKVSTSVNGKEQSLKGRAIIRKLSLAMVYRKTRVKRHEWSKWKIIL